MAGENQLEDASYSIEENFERILKTQLYVSNMLYKTHSQYSNIASKFKPYSEYSIGDQVLIYAYRDGQMSNKLSPHWIGPVEIIDQKGLEYSVKYSNGNIVN